MTPDEPRKSIPGLTTGIPALDLVIGEGGVPEYSFTLIAGGPGTGKTTLAQQFMFANATVERPAVYFTVLGEPPLKMMRYLHQRSFFQKAAINRTVRFVNLSKEAMSGNLDAVYDSIIAELESSAPGIVVVDSFRSVQDISSSANHLASFVQRLAIHLTGWQATTFLIGEYHRTESESDPVFTVADGVLWLQQTTHMNTVVRRLQVVKMRGRDAAPGLHAYRITVDGLEVFANVASPPRIDVHPPSGERVSTGVPGLDDLLGGGLTSGGPVLLAGPAGTGKTIIATQFLAEAAARGDHPVLALFEETPARYLQRAGTRSVDLAGLERDGKLKLLHIRGLDLSVPQMMQEILHAVIDAGARSLVIDSVTGLEVSLEVGSRPEFRQAVYRLVMALAEMGVTVLMTLEQIEHLHEIKFSDYNVSFLAEAVIWLRYVELDGSLRKVITVVKRRDNAHSDEFRVLDIDGRGARVGAKLTGYCGLLTGVPSLRTFRAPTPSDLDGLEEHILRRLRDGGRLSSEQLASELNATLAEVHRSLRRMSALRLVTRLRRKDGSLIYRAGGRKRPGS